MECRPDGAPRFVVVQVELPTPTVSAPILFGAPAPPGELLPWGWARSRLVDARTYWVASTRPDGRPHCRPVWGVWLADGLWFSTGSLARRILPARPAVSVNVPDGEQVVVLEGTAAVRTERDDLQRMCDAYSRKYDHPMAPSDDGRVGDPDGNAGPAFLVTPDVVFGWGSGLTTPTRWRFRHR